MVCLAGSWWCSLEAPIKSLKVREIHRDPQIPFLSSSFSSSSSHLSVSSWAATDQRELEAKKKKRSKRWSCVMKSTVKKRLEDLLTHSPLSTKVCSWEYVSKMDIWGHQVWMVLSKPITGEIRYKFPLNTVYVLFLTGCRFLFSRWFCSMIFKSCSPSSILSVKEKKNS